MLIQKPGNLRTNKILLSSIDFWTYDTQLSQIYPDYFVQEGPRYIYFALDY